MEKVNQVAALIGSVTVIVGVVVPFILWVKKITEAIRCMLRDSITTIYYDYDGTKEIPQYKYESEGLLFKAYKALGGNSFIDKIHDDMKSWTVKR